MKLVRIALKNFRQYQNVEIEFSAGLIGITGGNGAGKTTLIEAITFAMYGTKAIRGKVEDLKTKGVGREKVQVELTFNLAGSYYRILRSTTDASFFVGGEALAGITGSREVTTQVIKLIGMNLEEFTATFLTEQKGLEFLSGKKGSTEREKFIARMMGFDKLETLQSELREQRKERKQRLTGFEGGLGDRSLLEERLEKEKADLLLLSQKLVEKTKNLEEAKLRADEEQKKFAVLEKAFVLYRSKHESFTVSQTKYSEATKRLQSFDERLQFLDTQVIFGKSYRDLREEASLNPDHSVEALMQKVSQHVETLSSKEKILSDDLQKFHMERKVSRARVEEKLIVLSKQQVDEEKKLLNYQGLKKKGASCPTCGQQLGDNIKKVMNDIEQEVQRLIVLISTEKKFLDESLQPSEAEKQMIADLAVVRDNLIQEKKLLPQCDLLKNITAEITLIGTQQAALRDELITLDELLRLKRKELSEISFSEPAFASAKASLAAADAMVNVARSEKLLLDGDLKTVQSQVDRTAESLLVYDQKQATLGTLRKELLIYEESDIALTEFRKDLNENIRPRIAELASEFLSELTEGRYSEVFIGPDFSPTVYDAGEIKSVISGGETDILHLCVRLSLSQMLAERAGQSFNLLILDEVFGSLDAQRRQNVLLLLEKLSQRFEQILIITHMDDIREGVDAVLQVTFDPDSGTADISEGEAGGYYF